MRKTFKYRGHKFTVLGQFADSVKGAAINYTRRDEYLDDTFDKYKGTYDYDKFYKIHNGEADVFKLEGFDKPVVPCANTFMIWEGETKPYDETQKDTIKNLKNGDVSLLKEWGCEMKDIYRIDEVFEYTSFETSRGKKVSASTARRMLGTPAFLSGLSRSAFHTTSLRDCANGKGNVYIDSREYFR